ncbi:lysozyme g isoform X2 [Salmo salar]|uniref:Lysozyme g n=1 Tax=Salmo salar TaxID=8030 RepID=A0A1S3PU83_SALSA|nr:lysozyme g-like isoform X2 [Salmo salar]|eukprot:XP_014031255.1 PREDICTED: lysozyme g-like isoform X2 [Salmo salar]
MGLFWSKCGDKYGDIMKVETTGASKETADADGHARGYSGVSASERMAEDDEDDVKRYIDIIKEVDVDPNGGNHKRKGEWDSKEHLEQATGILIHFIEQIKDKFPKCTKEQQLKGGIAAYNQGDGAIDSLCEEVDENTTGKDYSNDVVARAQWYHTNLV